MIKFLFGFAYLFSLSLFAQELSLSARLSQPDGSPLEGVVDLRFELSYSGAPETVICTKDMTGTTLTNGLFQLGLNFSNAECGGSSLSDVLESVPASEAMLFRVVDVTDPANPRTYPFQSLKAVPLSVRSEVAQTLARNSAVEGQVLRFVGGEWTASNETAEVGTVSEINTGAGLTGGPITSSGTIAIASGGVTSAMVADGTLVDADLSATAAIARNKIATGTANYVLVNDGSGVMSEIAILPLSSGGTGAANAADARFNLGLGSAALRNVGLLAGELLDSGEIPSCALDEKIRKVVMPVAGFVCESGADATKLALAGGTMSGIINMNANVITNLADPSLAQDAATKSYVDGQIGGGAANQWSESGGNVYRASGNVGIGTMSPQGKLHIEDSTLGQRSLVLATTGTVDPELSFRIDGEERAWISFERDSSTLRFATKNNDGDMNDDRLVIDQLSGNVGLGTVTPGQRLHVTQDQTTQIDDTPMVYFSTTGTPTNNKGNILWLHSSRNEDSDTADLFKITNGVGTKFNVRNNGNIGIGVLSPQAKLDINGQIKISGGSPGAGKVLTSDASGLASWVAPSTTAIPTGTASGDLAGNYPGPVIAPGAVTDAKVAAGANIAQSKIANLTTDLAAKQAADSDLTGLSNLATNGVMVRTGSGTYQTRALNGVANRTVVTNADGVTGNPTIDVSASLLPSPLAGDATRFLRATGANTTSWLALLGSDITTALGYTPINKVGDSIGSGVFDFNSTAVVRANNPVGTRDVANKSYVDTQVSSAANQWTAAGGNVYRASGNVGIGTSTPSSLNGWQKVLDVHAENHSRVATTVDNGTIQIENGVYSHNLIQNAYAGYPQNYGGIGLLGTITNHDVGIMSNNQTRVHISKNGDVGVGTISPQTKLQVDGTLTLRDPSSRKTQIVPPGNSLPAYIRNNETVAGFQFQNNPSGDGVTFQDLFTIDPFGNIGAGTSAPISKFQIENAQSIGTPPTVSSSHLSLTSGTVGLHFDTNQIVAQNTNLNLQSSAGPASILRFWTNEQNRMVINADGNVGVGTSAPVQAIDIQRDGDAFVGLRSFGAARSLGIATYRANGTSGTPTKVLASDQLAIMGATGRGETTDLVNSAAKIEFRSAEDWTDTTGAADIAFFTRPSNTTAASTERMRIRSTGNVGVGTSNPAATLDVNGSVRVQSRLANFVSACINGNIYTTTGYDAAAMASSSWVALREGTARLSIRAYAGVDCTNYFYVIYPQFQVRDSPAVLYWVLSNLPEQNAAGSYQVIVSH